MKLYYNKSDNFWQIIFNQNIILICTMIICLSVSCEKDEEINLEMTGALTLSTSSSAVVLNQRNDESTAVSFNWTTGTNYGTGASISYILQIDKQGNDFATAIILDMGKAVYSRSYTVSELNDSLLTRWNFQANEEGQLEARVIAQISSTPQQQETSNIVTLSVTPYLPVSTTLYILGDATSNGWDINSAAPMTASENDPTTFTYQGALVPGELMFITTLGQLHPSYHKGTDNEHLLYCVDESQPVENFLIDSAGTYEISLNLLDLIISINKVPYSNIYMVGSAAPNGWDIANATELVKDEDNPYLFTYTGVMNVGEFKFPVNRNTDWGQDMYMMSSDSTMYLHYGGDPDDSKWTISKKGFYKITLNLRDLTVSMERTKLYIVGSATPIDWDIANAIELVEDNIDGCIFIYSGEMKPGEFKFPVNRNTDWGQDMYMRVDDNTMFLHIGGSNPDDFKWNITENGNYIITANIEYLTIDIQKQ